MFIILNRLIRAHFLIQVDTAITQGTLASGGGLTFIFKDFLKYVMQNCFWIIRILDLLTYPEDVSAFLYIVFNIIVRAFVG